MKKRLLGIFLALVMCLTLLPTGAVQVRAEGAETGEGDSESPVETRNCHEMTEDWFGGSEARLLKNSDSALEDVVRQWFLLREGDFPGVAARLSSEDFSLSEQTASERKLRKDGIQFMQEFLGIELLDADVTARIIENSIEHFVNGAVTLYVYEWTFYDYDDLSDDVRCSDVAGYGTYHKITLSPENDTYKIVSDEYDEWDITGICTTSDETRKEMTALGYMAGNESGKEDEGNNTAPLKSTNYYSGYDISAAVAYADKYALDYNPAYASFSQDCANFVSQCIYAGGMPQVSGSSGWYYNSVSNYSASWTMGATLKSWMANNRGNKVAVNTSNCKTTVFPGSPIFQDQHATICVGYNSAGTPIWNAHTNDRYHYVFNSYFDYTVQLTPSADYTPTPGGQCGDNATWKLSSDGTLTISGSGPMWNCTYDSSPWYDKKGEIKRAVIESGVTSVGEYFLYKCTSLTSVAIGNSVTSIGTNAFYLCEGLSSLTIGNSVTSIESDAFCACSGLTSVTIPNSVTSIGNDAFNGCSGVTSLTIGNSVKSIGDTAFYGLSITSLTIPNSVTSIGKYVFWNCKELRSVSLGNGVASIGSYAFYQCSSLASITIPNSVTSLGPCAFQRCSGLRSAVIGSGLTSIAGWMFAECNNLTSVTIPNSVTSIGPFAFFCKGVQDVYYGGTKAQWDAISIDDDHNGGLLDATIHYAYTTVTLNAMGGKCGTASVVRAYGEAWNLPTPTNSGYTFNGWYSQKFGKGTKYLNDQTCQCTEDEITLYASWKKNAGFEVIGRPDCGMMAVLDQKQLDGVNESRGVAALILYNTEHYTNEYGNELAVDADGRITGTRYYGDTTQLEVPNGGFILSGHSSGGESGGEFVYRVRATECTHIFVDYETGLVYACKERTAQIVSGSFSGNNLVATVSAPASSRLIVAVYDTNGRMTGTLTRSINADCTNAEYTFAFSKLRSGYTYKLLIVDAKTYTPLCKGWSCVYLSM